MKRGPTLIELLITIAIIAILAVILVGAAGGLKAMKPQAERAVPQFIREDLERFTMKKQSTPPGYPDLYLIHDSVTGRDLLYVEGHQSAAGFTLEHMVVTNAPTEQ